MNKRTENRIFNLLCLYNEAGYDLSDLEEKC